jgi:hypothetical protein
MKTETDQKGSLELRKRLPHGGIQELATKYHVTWQWVHKVVTGKFNGDPRIIRDACKMAEIEDNRRSELIQVIRSSEMELSRA